MLFAFNWYCHWDRLVTREGYGKVNFLFSKERVTQGDPLAMLVYGHVTPPPPHPRISKVPLSVTQTWYANYAGGGRHLKGYPKSPVLLDSVRATTRLLPGADHEHLGRVSPERPGDGGLFWGYRLQIVTGSRYLGQFVGSKAVQDCWLG